MRPGRKVALAIAIVIALVGAVGCGVKAEKDVTEGEPLDLGDLQVNVQLTRFLNPADPEDGQYLEGQKLPPPVNHSYLAVFMTIKNTGDNPVTGPTADQMKVVDTTGVTYAASPASTVFAVPLGATIPPGGEIPGPETAAANGPAKGSIALFLVDDSVNENRPLVLEIEDNGETGKITLDI